MQIKFKKCAYSAWVLLMVGSCGDPRGERLSDEEAGWTNLEVGGGTSGCLVRPNKRLNLNAKRIKGKIKSYKETSVSETQHNL